MELKVRNLGKKYGNRVIFDSLCFEVRSGEWLALVGKNGTGKSTLLKILAGADRETEGSIAAVKGKSMAESADGEVPHGRDDMNASSDTEESERFCDLSARKKFGYLPQDNPLFPELTVKDNIKFWCKGSALKGIHEKQKSEALFEALGLGKLMKTRVEKLSGGQKRKLSLYIAMHDNPQVLLLDEPSSALDMETRQQLDAHLKQYVREGGIIIMATHDREEMELADRRLELD